LSEALDLIKDWSYGQIAFKSAQIPAVIEFITLPSSLHCTHFYSATEMEAKPCISLVYEYLMHVVEDVEQDPKWFDELTSLKRNASPAVKQIYVISLHYPLVYDKMTC